MKLNYFLLAVQVVYVRDKLERSRNLNILVTSKEKTVDREQLGRSQQQAQVRFFQEFDPENKSEIIDVFIMSVNHLGEMTEKQFHGQFGVPNEGQAEDQPEEAADEDTGEADLPETEEPVEEEAPEAEPETEDEEKPQ